MPKVAVRFNIYSLKGRTIMKQEIEIEFKNLLTQEEFQQLQNHFNLKEQHFKHQVNHYFDTPDYKLKKHGAALRIREKDGKYVLTLKQPATEGLLESHESLQEEQAQAILSNNTIPAGKIAAIIQTEFSIQTEELHCFGSLATSRAELDYKGGTLVFDHSRYLNKEDFELEYEVTDYTVGKVAFENLLKELNIPSRETDNKIKRFYNEKFKN